jgi:DNA-binding NarL/FixJ family response regulator
MRILIADDNELIRRGVADMLANEANVEVCGEAHDGMDALQKAQELQPDLVLLDISMPGITGFESARLLRQSIPHIKILIMSFGDQLQLLPRALEAGANECVDKARLASDLLGAINSLRAPAREQEDPNAKNASRPREGLSGSRNKSQEPDQLAQPFQN